MNIKHIIVLESLFFIACCYLVNKFFIKKSTDKIFKVSNLFFWGSLLILSILINLQKFLFFISTFLIIIIVCILFLIKNNIKKYFTDNLYLGVYMLLAVSFFGIFNFIVAKYFIYTMNDSEAPIGDSGEQGKIGEDGNNFFVDKLGERCYVDLINNLENKYKEIKKINNIDFDNKEYQIKNYYLKDNIKRICYSKQFLDNFYLGKTPGNITPECVMKYNRRRPQRRMCNVPDNYGQYRECKSDKDCYIRENDEVIYRRLLTQLKGETELWLKKILRNSCEEDIRLRDKLGGQVYETLDQVNSSEQFDSNLKYNSRIGHKFLNDYFQNDVYLNENLNTQVKENPFNEIKDRSIWKWGIPDKKCVN